MAKMFDFNVISHRKLLCGKLAGNQAHIISFITGAGDIVLSPCKPTLMIIRNSEKLCVCGGEGPYFLGVAKWI